MIVIPNVLSKKEKNVDMTGLEPMKRAQVRFTSECLKPLGRSGYWSIRAADADHIRDMCVSRPY